MRPTWPLRIGKTLSHPKGRKNSTNKVLVAVAVEILQPKGFGRIRLRRIPKDSAPHVIPFVQEVVEAGARVHTDGSAAYRSLTELGYVHQRTVMLGSDVPAHVSISGRASGGCARATLDSGHTPWLDTTRASGCLSGRICVPLQSPHIEISRHVVLSTSAASCRDSTSDLSGFSEKNLNVSAAVLE